MPFPERFTDQMGRLIELNSPPTRIISLVPSQTELLAYLNLDQEVIGITKFCIHPTSWYRSKPRIGGTKQINFDKLKALQPDLIIGNKEENDRAQIEQLEQHWPVWMSDITTLEQAMDMIKSIGQLTNRETQTDQLIEAIQSGFNTLEATNLPSKRVVYFIWKDPWMAAGRNTFIDDMLQRIGFENVFAHNWSRYPEIQLHQLEELNPELILLSSEPYPFKEKHIQELRAVFPRSIIRLVDGELFSWYGSRLLHVPQYLSALRATL